MINKKMIKETRLEAQLHVTGENRLFTLFFDDYGTVAPYLP